MHKKTAAIIDIYPHRFLGGFLHSKVACSWSRGYPLLDQRSADRALSGRGLKLS